jgi:hypothetical protein
VADQEKEEPGSSKEPLPEKTKEKANDEVTSFIANAVADQVVNNLVAAFIANPAAPLPSVGSTAPTEGYQSPPVGAATAAATGA